MIENIINPFRPISERDLEREYRFNFTLSVALNTTDTKFLSLGTILLPYISTLAKRVSPIPRKIQTETLSIGVVDIIVPKKVDLELFTVDYLEDNEATVWNMHRTWMSLIGGGSGFSSLYRYAASCTYTPYYENPIPAITGVGRKVLKYVPVPTSVNVYPHVVPIETKHTSFDKEGQSLSGVTVTYVVIPSYILNSMYTETAVVTKTEVKA